MQLRDLPSVDELAREVADPLAVDAARTVLERAREEIRAGFEPGDLTERLRDELTAARRPALRRALNATGVVVHTNLGRAPLSEAALERVREVGRGYSNLEYDLRAGTRGSRQDHVAGLLRRLTGAEAALVVNNNAAAVLLTLAALAEDREVLVSRGELLEILLRIQTGISLCARRLQQSLALVQAKRLRVDLIFLRHRTDHVIRFTGFFHGARLLR